MPDKPKLLVRLKTSSRDFDFGSKDLIIAEENDPIKIVSANAVAISPWDDAHEAINENPDYSFAEPDIESGEAFYKYREEIEEKGDTSKEDYYKFIDYWPSPSRPSIWHLGQDFSQLKMAREEVAALPNKKVVRIAHFDTGYSKKHLSFPAIKNLIRTDLQRNFVEGEEDRWNNAEDKFESGTLKMPGHGTGTLSILAGGKLSISNFDFDDYLGLYDSIEIVPVRIAKSVVLFKSGSFVRALDYVVNELNREENNRVHIITMSMGGVASRAWADLVNLAYEKGIFMVTAAGNNFNKLPTRTMIYPARFNRVVAACGVTFDQSPYAKPKGAGSFYIMEGNYGPQSLMNTAIAAYTPNVPWATYRFDDVVGIRGDGTSSATPQVASAAALYYLKYFEELEALPEPWMRVEAIRKAMFESAAKEINNDDGNFEDDYQKYFGNGILRAAAMLEVKVASPNDLLKQDKDRVSFPFFKVILGLKAMEEPENPEEEMLETELMQLVLTDETLQKIMQDEEKKMDDLDKEEKIALAAAVIKNEKASEKLKERMQMLINQLNL
ncbi:MAG: S8/S53 family peptidase [Ferruginibacter sp.]|nr:S8/S53 family peptidase [Ferruginibacter sp.]